MGMTAFEVFGVLKLDTNEFSNDLQKAEGSTKNIGSAIGSGLATAAKVGAAAITAASGAAVAFGQNAISAATSYESAFTGVRKTVDATEEEYNALSDWIMDASTKMASSKEEIAATMEIAGQLGVSGVEGLEKFTETMIMLGDTTNLNAEEAASALAKFGNITGVGAEDMDKIGSVIVDLGNHFATTEADIVNMATRLASAGTIAGLSSTDILALSTAMSSVGIQAEAGGTAMSQTLANMSKAVDMGVGLIGQDLSTLDKDQVKAITQLENFANVAGMSAQEFADAWKGDPMTAVSAFINGLHNLNEEDESVIMTLEDLGLKGIRQTNMLQSLALASDMMGDAVDTANTAFEENSALMDEANKRYGTTESQAIQTAEAFKNLKVQIGDELLPVYSDLMSFSSEAMKTMSEGLQSGGIDGLVESMGQALSDGLKMLTEKLPDIVELGMDLIGALGKGFSQNLPTILKSTLDIINMIISSLSGGIPSFLSSINLIVKILAMNLINEAPVLVKAVLDTITSLIKLITDNAPILLKAVIEIIVELANRLAEILPTLIPTIISFIIDIANLLVENVGVLINAAITLIRALADGIIQALPILIEAIPPLLEAVLKAILENIAVIITAGIEILLALATGIIDAIPQLIAMLPEIIFAIVQALLQATPQILESGIELMIALGKGLIQAIPQILSLIPRIIWEIALTLKKESPRLLESGFDLVMKIGDGIKEKISEAMTWGKDLIDNFIEGIKAKIENIKKVAAYVGKSIKDFLGFSEPEKGPLSDFHTYAPDMMDLFAKGIKDNENVVTGQIEKSFNFGQIPQMQVAGAGGIAYNYSDDENDNYGDIVTAIIDALMNMQLVVNIGNRPIEAMITSAQQRTTYRSGGR